MERPFITTAKDCAAVAMSCKALSIVAKTAWRRCAAVAECQPDIYTLARKWGCIYRSPIREHLYKLVRNLPCSHSRMGVVCMRSLLKSPGVVGESCPIPWKAAAYILNVSWLRINKTTAEQRFFDRDLSRCEHTTISTLRYRSVLLAPLRPDTTPSAESVSRHIEDLRSLEAALNAYGIERLWGETNLERMQQRVNLYAWAEEVALPATMLKSMDAYVRRNATFPF
jgi:hypothetical protein